MRVAAIDIGTNSVLLVIAEERGGVLHTLVDLATITRLGEGVDRNGVLAPAACERTLTCLREYARKIRRARVTRIDVVGTSALRDARGGDQFVRDAEAVLGVRPRVIGGDEEARLTFSGALSGLAVSGDVVVFDVGGGSTEVIIGSSDLSGPRLLSARSLNIGSVRLFERHLHGDPPVADEIAKVRRVVRDALAGLPRPPRSATWVGVAGTVTTLTAIDQTLEPYDGARVHGARLSAQSVERTLEQLARLDLASRRALKGLEPARADVIVAGAVIVSELLAWGGASGLVASDRGVRWGVVRELLDP
jgi:exopolyphosphatase / guanosine-5'-triphosphate,3'-diphosphate pyrophosphatase